MGLSSLLVFVSWVSMMHYLLCAEDRNRDLIFPGHFSFAGRRLRNHKIKTEHVKDLHHCGICCYLHDDCVSFNFKTSPDGLGRFDCELNNSTNLEHDEDLTDDNAYLYRGAKNACGKNPPCHNNATCQTGFKDKGYRCLCPPAFAGEYCEKDATVQDCSDAPSTNGVYYMRLNNALQLFPVYCDQTTDGGGWTMVFKFVGGITASPTCYQLWSSSETLTENVEAALDTTSAYRGHYKNRIVQNWQTFDPQEARVVLYRDGAEVASLKFNVAGTDKLNWFSQMNLVQSPWSDLKSASNLLNFAIFGACCSRSFEIMANYGGCPVDAGWFVITGSVCPWEKTDHPVPSILYSKQQNVINWQNAHADVGVADVMIVYVR